MLNFGPAGLAKRYCYALLVCAVFGFGHLVANIEVLGLLFGEWLRNSPAAALSLICLWIVSPGIQLTSAVYGLISAKRSQIPLLGVLLCASATGIFLWCVKGLVFASTNTAVTVWAELVESNVYGSDGIRGVSPFALAATVSHFAQILVALLLLRSILAIRRIDNHSQ